MDATWLRHFLSVLAFRLRHAVDDAPENYWKHEAGNGAQTPIEVLHHVTAMALWVASNFLEDREKPMLRFCEDWQEEEIGAPDFELAHFHRALVAIDAALAAGKSPCDEYPIDALFRGPLADSMTHVGQLAMLRRLAGSPVSDVEFWAADTAPGKILP